jgi:hypothetical protein
MSLPPRTFFAGLASCLDDIAGELSGETDISSSSALRFLEAMVYCGTGIGGGIREVSHWRGKVGGCGDKRTFIVCGRRTSKRPANDEADGATNGGGQ